MGTRVQKRLAIVSLLTLVLTQVPTGLLESITNLPQQADAAPASYTFTNGALIREFVRSFPQYSYIPTEGPNSAAMQADAVTLAKICQLRGLPVVASYTVSGFASCYNNTNAIYHPENDTFEIVNSCGRPAFVETLTCSAGGGSPAQCTGVPLPQPATRTFADEGRDAIRFVNSFGTFRPILDGDSLDDDPATAAKICQLAGYGAVDSVSRRSFSSPGNNLISHYDASVDNFIAVNAADAGNVFLDTIVCGTPLCNAQSTGNNAACTNLSTPNSVTAGQQFTGTFTMQNNGTTTWSLPNYNLYDVASTSGRWGPNGAPLPATTAPGSPVTFTQTFTAPATTGTFPFQFRMGQNGVEFFGETCQKNITVTAASTTNNGTCQITNTPTTVTAGQTFSATFNLANTGNSTWTSPNFNLYDTATVRGNWGTPNLDPPNMPVGPSQTRTLTTTLTAPTTPGTYAFQWQLGENGVGFFGNVCSQTITVSASQGTYKDLTISKTDGRTTAAPGDTLNYTVTVTNPTNASITASIQDSFPTQTSFVSAGESGTREGRVITWANRTFAANSSQTFHVSVQVLANTPNNWPLLNDAAVLPDGATARDRTDVARTVTPQCSDGIDNDGDGKIDFGSATSNDPGCSSASDNDETNLINACQDAQTILRSVYSTVTGGTDPYTLNQDNTTAFCNAGDSLLMGAGELANCDNSSNPACGHEPSYEFNGPTMIGQNASWVSYYGVRGDRYNDTVREEAVCAPSTTVSNQYFSIYNRSVGGFSDPFSLNQNNHEVYCDAGDLAIGGGGYSVYCNKAGDPGCDGPQMLEFNGRIVNGNREGWRTDYSMIGDAIYDTLQTTVVCMKKTAQFDSALRVYHVVNNNTADPYSLDQNRTTAFCNAGDIAIGGGGNPAFCDTTGNPACGRNQYLEANRKITVGSQQGWLVNYDLGGNAIYDTQHVEVTCLGIATNACATQNGADLSITKSGPASVTRGSIAVYNVRVTNAGPATATNVTVSDVIPTGFQFNAANSSSNCVLNSAGTSVLCNNFSLNAGEFRDINIAFFVPTISSCTTTTMTNTATVSTSATDPNAANNSATSNVMTVNCPQTTGADLSITKTGPSTVVRGTPLTYTVTATNAGPDTATNVVISDVIPTGLSASDFNASASTGCVLNGAQTSILCNNFSLTSGQSRTFSIVFNAPTLSNCTQSVNLSNVATVSASSTDNNSSNNTSTTVTTSMQCPTNTGADLSITKTGPSTVVRGNTLTYVVTATNAGPGTATNVVIADVIPTGLSASDFNASASTGCVLNGGNTSVLCNNFSLTAGQSRSFNIVFTAPTISNCSASVNVSNVATVSASSTDNNSSNNTSTTVTTSMTCPVQVTADLSIIKTGPTSVTRGNQLDYTITVTNGGPGMASNIVIGDFIPAGLSATDFNASASTGCVLNSSNTSVLCNNFSLNNGETKTVHIIFNVPTISNCTQSTLLNYATVSSSITDPVDSNNRSSTVATTVLCPGSQPNALTISKTDNRTTAAPGDTLNYVITVSNPTSSAITATITDTLPSQTSGIVGINNNGTLAGTVVTWNVTVAANATQTLTVSAVINAGVSNGTVLTNVAQVVNGNAATDTTTVQNGSSTNADLSITKTGPASVTRGNTLAYTVTATNAGPATATNVVIGDVIPTGLTSANFNASASTGCVLNSSNTSVLCNNFNLAANESKSFSIVFNVPTITSNCTTSTLSNTATVSGSSTDPTSSNNTSSAVSTTVLCSEGNPSSLTISKSDGKTTAAVGDTLTYTITITNPTSTPITYTVTDTLPSQVTYVSSSNSGSRNGQVVTWSNLSIAANTTATLTVTATVNSGTADGTVLTNSAQITNGSSATDTTTVSSTANPSNITIDVSDSKDPVRSGESVCYTVAITNLNSQAITLSTVTGNADSKLTFQSASDGGTNNGQTVTWTSVSIGANTSKQLSSCYVVSSSAQTNDILTFTASASGKADTETTRVDNGTTTTGGITVDITDSRDPVAPCEELTYSIEIRNTTSSSKTLSVTAFLDSQMDFVSASDGGTENGSRVEWTNITIGANSSKTLTLRVQVDCNALDGDTLQLRVRAGDVEGTENTRVRDDIVNPCIHNCGPNPQPGILTLDLRASRAEAAPGDTVTYTITIKNQSNAPVRNLSTVLDLDADVSVEEAGGGSGNGNTVRWNGMTLDPGEAQVMIVRARMSSSLRHGETVRAEANATSPDLDRPVSDSVDVRIITHLPQTGLGGFLSAWKANQSVLKPSTSANAKSESSAPLSPMGAAAAMIPMGLAAGSFLGRKFLFI